MGGFGNFNEPFYRTYITTDLGALPPHVMLKQHTCVLFLGGSADDVWHVMGKGLTFARDVVLPLMQAP